MSVNLIGKKLWSKLSLTLAFETHLVQEMEWPFCFLPNNYKQQFFLHIMVSLLVENILHNARIEVIPPKPMIYANLDHTLEV